MIKFNERGCLTPKRHFTSLHLCALTAFLMLALCRSCFAGIGETLHEAKKRYGKSVENEAPYYGFIKATEPIKLSDNEINTCWK